ncbi:MAG TPA: hypothetical protein VLM42_17845 [Bryobacteraceae bacterium]|nr:hypothetical protein [Bryobacteraceae bacterium]
MYYIGLDVHKKTISYCVKDASGQVHREGTIGATRNELDCWVGTLPQPRIMAMEATIFTGWIYDHLLPHAEQVFGELLSSNAEVHENIRPLLRLSRETIVRCQRTEYPLLKQRAMRRAVHKTFGGLRGNRTPDARFTRKLPFRFKPPLYQLSYQPQLFDASMMPLDSTISWRDLSKV